MIDGTYTIQVDTPFGKKPGKVVLRTEGDVVYADIDAPVVGRQQAEGKVDGNTFTAKGTFKIMLMGKIANLLRGEVKGDDISIVIDSSKGQFNLTGVRA